MKTVCAGLSLVRASVGSSHSTRSISGYSLPWRRKVPGEKSARSNECSTAQATTTFLDLRTVSPSGTHGWRGATHPVSSSNSRAAARSSGSPGLTSPLITDHHPESLRAK